jgi:hypothetical protein
LQQDYYHWRGALQAASPYQHHKYPPSLASSREAGKSTPPLAVQTEVLVAKSTTISEQGLMMR